MVSFCTGNFLVMWSSAYVAAKFDLGYIVAITVSKAFPCEV